MHYFKIINTIQKKIINTDLLVSCLLLLIPFSAKLVFLKLKSDPVPLLVKILEGPPLSLINPMWQMRYNTNKKCLNYLGEQTMKSYYEN